MVKTSNGVYQELVIRVVIYHIFSNDLEGVNNVLITFTEDTKLKDLQMMVPVCIPHVGVHACHTPRSGSIS